MTTAAVALSVLIAAILPSVPGAAAAAVAGQRDKTSPVASMTRPTAQFTTNNSVAVAWSAIDNGSGVASSDVRVQRSAVLGGPKSLWTTWKSKTTATSGVFTAIAGYRYCFSVRARDRAGNVSQWSSPRCTLLPIDDLTLYTSVGWVRVDKQVGGWLGGTNSSIGEQGAWLQTFDPVSVTRVGVVAKTGPTCATIAVFVGSVRVGTLDLSHQAASPRRLVLLAPFHGRRTGILKLVAMNAGEFQIDGLSVAP